MALQFWFEFASTYSYLAAHRVGALAQSGQVDIEWRPFLLGPVFARQGLTDSPFNQNPDKGRYMWRDMERLCAEYGIPFKKPSVFPRDSLLAARLACLGQGRAWLPTFVQAVYRCNFADDQDIADPALMRAILDALGQPGAELLDQAGTPEVKALLRAQTDQAMTLGIFGAPSFIAGGELFWGNDRLEYALARQLQAGA